MNMGNDPFKQFPYTNSADDANYQQEYKSCHQTITKATTIHCQILPPIKIAAPVFPATAGRGCISLNYI
jgi:hypothetical protein